MTNIQDFEEVQAAEAQAEVMAAINVPKQDPYAALPRLDKIAIKIYPCDIQDILDNKVSLNLIAEARKSIEKALAVHQKKTRDYEEAQKGNIKNKAKAAPRPPKILFIRTHRELSPDWHEANPPTGEQEGVEITELDA